MLMATTNHDIDALFVVYLDCELHGEATNNLDVAPLTEGLWLVRSALTQSQLYHQIKHATHPGALFVGQLDEHPKFKGMAAGALKWVRSGD